MTDPAPLPPPSDPSPTTADNALKKSKPIQFYVEPELYQQAMQYAREHGISLGALLRSLLRVWVNPEDPRPLPPAVDDENKRPSRRKPDPVDDPPVTP